MKPSQIVPLSILVLAAPAGFVRGTILTAPVVTNSAPAFAVPAFAGSNVVDQSHPEYASAGQGTDTFLEFSFGSPQSFDRIVVINRDSAGQSDLIGDFSLTMDGTSSVSIPRTAMRGASGFHNTGLRTATNVRLDVDTVGIGDAFNNTGAMEVIFARTPAGQTQVSGVSILDSATPFNADFAATNALDGIIGRISALSPGADWPEYASAGLSADAFVDFDLGAILPIGGFDWFDRPANPDRVLGFDMIFSQDATFGNGDDIIRPYQNSAMALGDEFSAINARYVRYDVTAAAGANTGLSEMIFYQVPEPSSLAVTLLAAGAVALRRRR